MSWLPRRVALIVTVVVAAGCGQGVPPTLVPGSATTVPATALPPAPTAPRPTEPSPTAAPAIDAVAARVQGVADTLDLTRTGIQRVPAGRAGRADIVAGLASKSPRLVMTPDIRFQIASITKPMTATVVLSLVEKGTLSLDDTVAKWLPGLLKAGKTITIEQLLTHTSGLFNFTELDSWSWADQAYTANESSSSPRRMAGRLPPARAPSAQGRLRARRDDIGRSRASSRLLASTRRAATPVAST